MKKIVFLLIGAALLLPCRAGTMIKTGTGIQEEPSQKGTLILKSTPELSKLANSWAGEYLSVNPDLKIRVISSTESGTQDKSITGATLTLMTRGDLASKDKSDWKIIVGRDAIVPVINQANPYLNDITTQGISAVGFATAFSSTGHFTWSDILQNVPAGQAGIYVVNDEWLIEAIAGFTKLPLTGIEGIRMASGPELIAAVQKDPNAIGFCRLSDILDASGENITEGIRLLPIDKNGNGRLDYIEKIYDNVNDLSRGIWIGKFPGELCRNVYISSPLEPASDQELAFLKFVLTTGQQNLNGNGFTSLTNTERISSMDKLPGVFIKAEATRGINITQLLITILAGILFVLAIISFVIRNKRFYRPSQQELDPLHTGTINEPSLTAPKGLYFDKTHTWSFMEPAGTVKIGIDDFLQHVTGRISSVKLRKPGESVKKGETVLTIIQNGKRLNIKAPISGIILACNNILFTDSSIINSAPYSGGWIYRLEPTNWIRETQFLFMSENYREWIKKELVRLKDFLAGSVNPQKQEYAFVILQDGGEITDKVLENLGPEVWEDFQTHFIDTSK